MSDQSDFAGHHSAEYRRGFVLGLTLAESMMLLLFVLLLLLLLGFERRENQIEVLQESQQRLADLSDGKKHEELLRLIEKGQAFEELEQVQGLEISDDFIELVQEMAIQSRTSGLNFIEKIEEQSRKIEALNKKLEQFSDLGSPESILKELELATVDESTLRGQVAELQRMLESSGNGRVLPSCWSTERGDIQFLLDVTLLDEGIYVQETIPLGREVSRARLPLATVDLSDPLSVTGFLEWSADLFNYSVEEECRFYVRVRDSTGPMMKGRFKELLSTVENHFYKLLLKA